MKVVLVNCDDQGNVDINDLRSKAETHAEDLSCLMITYPSTHGVYEEGVRDICDIIHANGLTQNNAVNRTDEQAELQQGRGSDRLNVGVAPFRLVSARAGG